jgi:hypothetical protein
MIVIILLFSQQNNPPHVVKPIPQKLPDDVERVMEGYTYRETDNGLAIDLSGNRVIYRGRQVLGLRSNLIKSTYFETIRGRMRSEKVEVNFSASDAEWDTKPSSLLLLRRNVLISVNDRVLPGVKTARIYFKQRVMEVVGDRKETVLLR